MPGPAAVTIGNFDGVHRGHAALVAAAREEAGASGRVVVVAFDPAPITVLRPDAPNRRLTTFGQRVDLLRRAGADEIVRLEPTPALLALAPDAFVAEVVARRAPAAFVEGPDFRFGRDRAGDVALLRALGARHGFRVRVIEPVEAALVNQHVVRVSSTMVRWLLEAGRVRDAARLLGRPFAVIGAVEGGDRRGRTLGVPTANLAAGEIMLPADGIYSGRGRRAGEAPGPWHAAAISVGTKPTFGGTVRVCEAHLLDWDGPLDEYGWPLELAFEGWMRDQIRYDDVDALVRQLERDVARVRSGAVGGAA